MLAVHRSTATYAHIAGRVASAKLTSGVLAPPEGKRPHKVGTGAGLRKTNHPTRPPWNRGARMMRLLLLVMPSPQMKRLMRLQMRKIPSRSTRGNDGIVDADSKGRRNATSRNLIIKKLAAINQSSDPTPCCFPLLAS